MTKCSFQVQTEEKESTDLAESEAENIPHEVHEKDFTSVTMTRDAVVVEYRHPTKIELSSDMFKQLEFIHAEKDTQIVVEDAMNKSVDKTY